MAANMIAVWAVAAGLAAQALAVVATRTRHYNWAVSALVVLTTGTIFAASVGTILYVSYRGDDAGNGSNQSAVLASPTPPSTTTPTGGCPVADAPGVQLCTRTGVSRGFVSQGDEVELSMYVRNDSAFTVHGINFASYLPHSENSLFIYVPGSARIAFKEQPAIPVVDAWLKDGVNAGDLAPGDYVQMSFRVELAAEAGVPEVVQYVGQYRAAEMPNWRQCAVFTVTVPRDYQILGLPMILMGGT